MSWHTLKHGILAVALILFIGIGVRSVVHTNNRLQLKDIQLKDRSAELKELQLKYQTLNIKLDTELHQKNIDQDKAKQLEQERDNLKQQLEQKERELQARQGANRIAAERTDNAVNRLLGVETAYAASGSNKESWMAAAGIPESDWQAVDYIVSRESGWNPCSFYPGQSDCNANPSTACGLVMQNPCGKIPGSWTDPVAALIWQKQYVTTRYGGYSQAMSYWQANGNY